TSPARGLWWWYNRRYRNPTDPSRTPASCVSGRLPRWSWFSTHFAVRVFPVISGFEGYCSSAHAHPIPHVRSRFCQGVPFCLGICAVLERGWRNRYLFLRVDVEHNFGRYGNRSQLVSFSSVRLYFPVVTFQLLEDQFTTPLRVVGQNASGILLGARRSGLRRGACFRSVSRRCWCRSIRHLDDSCGSGLSLGCWSKMLAGSDVGWVDETAKGMTRKEEDRVSSAGAGAADIREKSDEAQRYL
ncbi:hypothetical protein F4780DRAFT_270594, partial [Xylariomycetidae sp. FL0641]